MNKTEFSPAMAEEMKIRISIIDKEIDSSRLHILMQTAVTIISGSITGSAIAWNNSLAVFFSMCLAAISIGIIFYLDGKIRYLSGEKAVLLNLLDQKFSSFFIENDNLRGV